ncbi:MAG: hypothetical protein LBV52_04440 [Spirochaetaceae bacterium]|jgi:hypothetical protein|nr:hypothetical protein [Spirochaetaceae bacterium]
MDKCKILCALKCLVFFVVLFAASFLFAEKNVFAFDLLESGLWEDRGDFGNRLNAVLYAPLNFSLRAQFIDRRPAANDEFFDGKTFFGAGLYRKESRLLYGQLEVWGLAARTKNVWAHSQPWYLSHKMSGADLKTTFSNGANDFYFNLASPPIKLFGENSFLKKELAFSANASVIVDNEYNVLFQGGSIFTFGKTNNLRFECLWIEKTLAEQKQTSWFSEKPYLMERKMQFYALNLVFSSRYVGFSADFAKSAAFSFGEDIYANTAITIGSKVWKISFAVDGAGNRYLASDGSVTGAGFRSAGKFEWFGDRNMQVALSTSLRSNGIDKALDRSNTKINYHFPIIKGYFITPSLVSAEFERNAASKESITDNIGTRFALNAGPLRASLKLDFSFLTSARSGDLIIPYPNIKDEHCLDFFKTTLDVSLPIFAFTFRPSISYKTQPNKDSSFDAALSASATGKFGRLTFKVSGIEEREYYLSWTLRVRRE